MQTLLNPSCIIVALLIASASVAYADAAPEQAIKACIASVHQQNPSSRYDAYVNPQSGEIHWYGTHQDNFRFDKCMSEKGYWISGPH